MTKKVKVIRLLCYILIVYQGIAIISTILNVIFELINYGNCIFFNSYVAWFVPVYYLLSGGNILNIIPLFLFAGITIFLFIKSSKDLITIDKGTPKSPLMNSLWIGISLLNYMQYFCFHFTDAPYCSLTNIFSNVAFFLAILIVSLIKYDYFKGYSKNIVVSNYNQIKGYAKLNIFIAVFAVVQNLWMHYFSDTKLSNPNNHSMIELDIVMLFVFPAINITILVLTCIYYYGLKKSIQPPSHSFLAIISIKQIVAVVIEIIVICINAFVIYAGRITTSNML